MSASAIGASRAAVDAGYVPPKKSWGPGDTMEMPRIEGQAAPKQKEFRAPDANQKKGGKGKIVAIVLVCLLAVGGAAAGVTGYPDQAARHLPRWMYVPDAALPALLDERTPGGR